MNMIVEKFFLADDLPISEQMVLSLKSKVTLALKYGFHDAQTDFEDPKAVLLAYLEVIFHGDRYALIIILKERRSVPEFGRSHSK